MSEKKSEKKDEKKDSERRASRVVSESLGGPSVKRTWLEKNMATLVGGGTFVLLVLLTVLMYFVNN